MPTSYMTNQAFKFCSKWFPGEGDGHAEHLQVRAGTGGVDDAL